LNFLLFMQKARTILDKIRKIKFQKFLLNYGAEPEDIRERVIIIRKRNVKKERQRRIDEFVLRAELNAAARRQKKKT